MDGLFGQFRYKCYLEEVASVGDCLEICPQLDSRLGRCFLMWCCVRYTHPLLERALLRASGMLPLPIRMTLLHPEP